MLKKIEMYEWIDEQAAPGSGRRYRDRRIDILEIPPDGQIPQVNDIVLVHDHAPGAPPLTAYVRYKVVERELMWTRTDAASPPNTPQVWSHMWLHVRKLES